MDASDNTTSRSCQSRHLPSPPTPQTQHTVDQFEIFCTQAGSSIGSYGGSLPSLNDFNEDGNGQRAPEVDAGRRGDTGRSTLQVPEEQYFRPRAYTVATSTGNGRYGSQRAIGCPSSRSPRPQISRPLNSSCSPSHKCPRLPPGAGSPRNPSSSSHNNNNSSLPPRSPIANPASPSQPRYPVVGSISPRSSSQSCRISGCSPSPRQNRGASTTESPVESPMPRCCLHHRRSPTRESHSPSTLVTPQSPLAAVRQRRDSRGAGPRAWMQKMLDNFRSTLPPKEQQCQQRQNRNNKSQNINGKRRSTLPSTKTRRRSSSSDTRPRTYSMPTKSEISKPKKG